MKKKLTIIGAGSAMFTKGLVSDLISRPPGGHEWSIALCDTDRDVLEGVTLLVKKMLNAKDFETDITSSGDRCDVLPGSDYVVSTIGVGGRRSWEQDVFIPRKYGVFQPVGDTAMPGGISRAMRMIPAMVSIAKDVKKHAPDSFFFNYSNPMAAICRALDISGDKSVTGLCHGVFHSEKEIAALMGYNADHFTTLAAGINHCTFIYDFRLNGRCVKDEIRSKVEKDRLDKDAFVWEFFLRHGAYPAPGDRHVCEFFTEYFPGSNYYGKILGKDAFSFEDTIAHGDRIHSETMMIAHSRDPLPAGFIKPSEGEEEQLIEIIDSIECDRRKIFYTNLPNQNAVSNLPFWSVVEIPAVAGASGLSPVTQTSFPNEFACMTNRFSAGVELTVEAALRGNRKLMEEAIMTGGYITDKDAVRKMTDELLAAQKQYLPQF